METQTKKKHTQTLTHYITLMNIRIHRSIVRYFCSCTHTRHMHTIPELITVNQTTCKHWSPKYTII